MQKALCVGGLGACGRYVVSVGESCGRVELERSGQIGEGVFKGYRRLGLGRLKQTGTDDVLRDYDRVEVARLGHIQ